MNYPAQVLALFMFILLFSFGCIKEESQPAETSHRKSPIAIAKTEHNNTYVKIVYGQPYKRGREIFGGLVPYNEVWRTGANEATELTTTGPLLFAGTAIDAGTYALFTIPGRESWTIILNDDLGQWGAFEYNSQMDVLRTEVAASKRKQTTEAFTIQFGKIASDTSSIILRWDQTEVRIPIVFVDSSGSAT